MWEVPGIEELIELLTLHESDISYVTVDAEGLGKLGRWEWRPASPPAGTVADAIAGGASVSACARWAEEQLIAGATAHASGDEWKARVRIAAPKGRYLAQPVLSVVRVPEWVDPGAGVLSVPGEPPDPMRAMLAELLSTVQPVYARMLADQHRMHTEVYAAHKQVFGMVDALAVRLAGIAAADSTRVQQLVASVVEMKIAESSAAAARERERIEDERQRLLAAAKAAAPQGILDEVVQLGGQLLAVHRGLDPDLAAALTSEEGQALLSDPQLRALFTPANLGKLSDPTLRAALVSVLEAP